MKSNRNRNRQTHSAILPDGSVNVSLLQLEIGQELADETRYAAEDSMKKRAIHMSKDYDEFEKFVSVSQLKPLHSSDVKELFTYRHGQHAHVSGNGNGNGNGSFGQIPIRTGDINHAAARMEGNQPGCDSALNNSLQNTRNNSNRSVRTKATTAEKKKITKKVKKKSKNVKASDAGVDVDTHTDAIIKNAMQLESEWRKLCTSPLSILQYLLLLPTEGKTNVKDADGMDPNEVVHLATSRLRNCKFESNSPSSNTSTRSRTLRLEPYDIIRLCKFEIQSGIMEGVLDALDLLTLEISSSRSSSASTSIAASLSPCISTLEDMTTTSTSATISTDEMYDMIAIGKFVYRWMDSLTKCGRFSLHADFLSAKQKAGVDRILSFLEDVQVVYSLAATYRNSEGKEETFDGSDNVSHHPSIMYMTEDLPSLRIAFLGS